MVSHLDSWDRKQIIAQRITERFNRLIADEKAQKEIQSEVAQGNAFLAILSADNQAREI
jgi:hypothetical protein